MFRISAITRVGLVAVACVAVAAPSALAKPPGKGNAKSLYGYAMSYTPSKATPKKAATVQSVPYGYAMSYTPTKATRKATRKAAKPATHTAATASPGPAVAENTDYEYYGSPSGS
jgi:hypothetical protein